MKTKFLFGLILTFGLSSFSKTPYLSFPSIFSPKAHSSFLPGVPRWQECNAKIQGGVDGFPWSIAKPFPWSDIQGIWKLRDGVVPFYLKAKVIRTTSNRKILNLSVISQGNCSRPIAQGLGYIDFSERNVVRAILNDGVEKYQLKLAAFSVRDLEIDSNSCGDNDVVVASIQLIGSVRNHRSALSSAPEGESEPENIMLKKTTDDIVSICRKLDNK